jgi:glycine cleavage system H protein
MMPISGKVLEVNDALTNQPELLNEDPVKNYLIKIEVKDLSELDSLLDFDSYQKTLH